MRKLAAVIAALVGLAGAGTQCFAQDDSMPSSTSSLPSWSSDDLDQMLGPIALYPDPLIGLILPASTVPSQIVMASRYLSQGGDPNQVTDQPWDPAVQGLAHYPDVLKWMDDNIAWTTQLGEAFAGQQSDVMDAIQRLRAKAQSLGNLQSTSQEVVQADDGMIDIEPANPDQIYVPDYQPDVIYEQPGVYCTFGLGFPIGVWLGFDWDWRSHHLIHWGRDHERPADWWRHPPNWRHKEIANISNNNLWRPKAEPGRVVVAGGDRGYGAGFSRPHATPTAPVMHVGGRPAERATVPAGNTRINRPVVETRPEAREARPAPREEARPVQRSEAPESAFGGSRSAGEVRAASSRGAESHQSASFGGGGGGRSSGGSSTGRR